MKFPKVFIIILNWNGLQDTLECLESVFRLNYTNFRVIVVDNGSTDDPFKSIKENYPDVIILQNGENLGFAGGNNVGIKYALGQGAQYIWLLNNDTTVERGCLKAIVSEAERSDCIGLVSPKIYCYDTPNEVQFAGNYMNWKSISLVNVDDVRHRAVNSENLCLWGTALLIKRELVETIGYLNDKYFAYWEDIEYSLRSIRAGYKNIVCESGKIFHKNNYIRLETYKKNEHYHYFMARNRMLLGKEYLTSRFKRLIFTIRYFAELSDYIQRCSEQHIDSCMNAAWQGLKGIGGPMTSKVKMPFLIKKILIAMSKNHPIFIGDILTLNIGRLSKKFKFVV